MKFNYLKIIFIKVIIWLAILLPAAAKSQTPSSTIEPIPTPALCQDRVPKVPRTYELRPKRAAMYATTIKKNWFLKLLPFVKGERIVEPVIPDPKYNKYSIANVASYRDSYGRLLPNGITPRLKEIDSNIEKRLLYEETEAEKEWQERQNLQPNALVKTQEIDAQKIRFRGLGARKLAKFDLREFVDVGEIGKQEVGCNSCWAFASVDAMQISRRLYLKRQDNSVLGATLRPEYAELVHCMIQ